MSIESPDIIYVMGTKGDWDEIWNHNRVNDDDVPYILLSEYEALKGEGFYGRACARLVEKNKTLKEQLAEYKDTLFQAGEHSAIKEEEVSELKQQISNLLAIMHRDGGHYQVEHGTKRACEEAGRLFSILMGKIDELEKAAEEYFK